MSRRIAIYRANGLTPQRVEPLLAGNKYLAIFRQGQREAFDLDEGGAERPTAASLDSRGVTYERLGDKAKRSPPTGPAPPHSRPKDEQRAKRPSHTHRAA